MARPGLFGGGISRASRGERRRAGAGSAPREGEKKRKAPPFKVVLRDAAELLRARRGRLVFGFPGSGLLVWEPGEPKGRRVTQSDGLPGEQIGRMSQDRMHDPPLLLVPTDRGLAVFRSIP